MSDLLSPRKVKMSVRWLCIVVLALVLAPSQAAMIEELATKTGAVENKAPDWKAVKQATCYPLTPKGRGNGVAVSVTDGAVALKLLPQVPYILVPDAP